MFNNTTYCALIAILILVSNSSKIDATPCSESTIEICKECSARAKSKSDDRFYYFVYPIELESHKPTRRLRDSFLTLNSKLHGEPERISLPYDDLYYSNEAPLTDKLLSIDIKDLLSYSSLDDVGYSDQHGTFLVLTPLSRDMDVELEKHLKELSDQLNFNKIDLQLRSTISFSHSEGEPIRARNEVFDDLGYSDNIYNSIEKNFQSRSQNFKNPNCEHIVVFILDGGIPDSHWSLDGCLISENSFFKDINDGVKSSHKHNISDYTHGTAIASVIAGTENNNGTISKVGMAPFVQIVPIALDMNVRQYDQTEEYRIDTYDVRDALVKIKRKIESIKSNSDGDSYNFIINMSFSQSDNDAIRELLTDELLSLSSLGCIVSVSAGDCCTDSICSITSPSSTEWESQNNIIGVSGYSLNEDGERIACGFANESEAVDFVLPAEDIIAANFHNSKHSYTASWGKRTGVSFAVPLFCSCAALIWRNWPELSAEEVVSILRKSGNHRTLINFRTHPSMIDLSEIDWGLDLQGIRAWINTDEDDPST
ncbi:MAG: S8/S53 family peptidase [bacterium]